MCWRVPPGAAPGSACRVQTLKKPLPMANLRACWRAPSRGATLNIPADLADRIEQALRRTVTDRLGIELRAGNVLLGTEKIAQGARSGAVTFLGHASDAGTDGPNKLAQAWRVGEGAEGSGLKGTILPLDRAALSVALGRDNVVHLALTDAAAAERLAGPLQRLMHFLGHEIDAAKPQAGEAANDDIDTKGE